MKNIFNFRIVAIFLLLVTTNFLFAQEQPTTSEEYIWIKTKDGQTIVGKVLERTASHFIIEKDNNDQVEIPHLDIKSFNQIEKSQIRNGKYWFDNPNASRNLYSPTGYGLRKGEGYYQNFMLFINHVGYGFSDNFTLGAGLIPFTFGEGAIFSITPKFSIPIVDNKVNAGLGVSYNHILGANGGIAYGVLTFGSRDRNFTVGSGYGMWEGDWAKRPIFTASATFRFNRNFGFVTENWFIPVEKGYNENTRSVNMGYAGFITAGLRYMHERFSVDLSVMTSPEIGSGTFPIVGVTIPFGTKM